MVDETAGDASDIVQVVELGSADIDAGRYTTVTTREDERRVYDGVLAPLKSRLSPSE